MLKILQGWREPVYRVTAVFACVLVSVAANASEASKSIYPVFDVGSTAPADVTGDVEAVIGDFAARYSSKAWYDVLELWDPDEETPYYLLAHQPDWLIGWDQLRGYFQRRPQVPTKDIPEMAPPGMREIEPVHYAMRVENELEAMLYTPSDIRVRLIAPDLALAAWYVDFQYKPRVMPAMGEEFKANAIFRRTGEGWRFIHYAEAPMSPIMYIERLYRKQASPEFIRLLEQKKRARRNGGAQ